MIKKLKRRLDDCDTGEVFFNIFMVVIIVFSIFAIAVCIASVVSNYNNKIDSGIVIDKHHTQTKRVGRVYYPESYTLTIKGEKNGKTVEYRFHCSKDEYDSYDIGDKYPKEEEDEQKTD